MISAAYLHEHDILDTFMEETHHIMNDVHDARNQLLAAENYIDEQVFMGESADDYEVMLEETKKNVFARIGDAVIEFFKSFGEMLKKFGSSIAESLKNIKKHRSDDVLKEQMEKNPELAKKFIDSVMSGNIKIHDVKDMDDLLTTAQELTKQLNSGKIDEKQYMDKVDEKLDKYASRARNITAILGVVVGATGILAFIDKLRGSGADVQLKAAESRDALNAIKEKAMREANKEAGGNSNRIAVWLKGQQKFAAAMGHDYSGWKSLLAKAEGGLGDLIGRVNTGYDRKDKIGPVERVARREKDARRKLKQQEEDRQAVMDKWKQVAENRRKKDEKENQKNAIRQENDRNRRAPRLATQQAFAKKTGELQAQDAWNRTHPKNNP